MSNKLSLGRRPLALLFCCLGVGVAGSVGCQVDVGGQTLPSPYYLRDDVQYFPAGPEMKLSNEAAALKAARAAAQGAPATPAAPVPPAPAQ